MKKHTNWLLSASLAIGGLAFVGCDDYDNEPVEPVNPAPVDIDTDSTTQPSIENDLDRAGDNLERGAEKTGDALERGMEKTGNALERAGEKIEKGVERTGEELREFGRDTKEAVKNTGERIDNNTPDVDVNVKTEQPANQPANQTVDPE